MVIAGPRRSLGAVVLMLAAACAPRGPSTSPSPSGDWVDSLMTSMSPRDKAAQLVWSQLFGDYTPASSAISTVSCVHGPQSSALAPTILAAKLASTGTTSR